MRNVKFMLKFIFACVLAFLLQLTLHEMGHALFALITGNEVVDVIVSVVSYAEINVINAWSIPIISIGSFVLPIVVCVLMDFIPSEFVRMLTTVILTITMIQLGINAVAILCEKNIHNLQTFDLGLVVMNSSINNILLGVLSIIIVLMLIVWLGFKLKRIVQDM